MNRPGAIWQSEVLVKTRTGAERWISNTLIQEGDGQRNVTTSLGILQDITERKQFEMERVRIERLGALGELSAGVSHNLNNILSGVLLPAQFLTYRTKDAEILEEVKAIISAGERAQDLVHRLHLSTKGVDDETLLGVDVNSIVKEAVDL